MKLDLTNREARALLGAATAIEPTAYPDGLATAIEKLLNAMRAAVWEERER